MENVSDHEIGEAYWAYSRSTSRRSSIEDLKEPIDYFIKCNDRLRPGDDRNEILIKLALDLKSGLNEELEVCHRHVNKAIARFDELGITDYP